MFLFFSSYLVKMKGKISIHLKYTKRYKFFSDRVPFSGIHETNNTKLYLVRDLQAG